MNLEPIRQQLRRRAVVFEIGGFRLRKKPEGSWFGRVSLAAAGEAWPATEGSPMHPLCQINLTELPFRPPRLDDIELITVFIGPTELPSESPNGTDWCLRAYPSVKDLVPLASVDTGSSIKPLPMRPQVVDEDFPMWEDVRIELPEDVADKYYDHFKNVGGLKLGGWPSLIQSEIYWAPWNQHPAQPEYVFQIDSTEKGNWMWGDNGVGYFGRGTETGNEHEWACEWQCY